MVPKFCCHDPKIPTLCCPPLKILHNFETGACRIISLLHNIRANIKLHGFIQKNLQNENFFSKLEKIINMEDREIEQDEWEFLKTFYRFEIVWEKNGGISTELLEGMFGYIRCKKNNDFKDFHKRCSLEYAENENKQNIFQVYKYYDIPFYTIYTGMYSRGGYINVSNALRGRPNNAKINDKSIPDTVYFKKADDFIILRMKSFSLNGISHKETGITIQKDVYINVEGKNQQQKYSLTGILLNETSERGLDHVRAFIKCQYQWYDTDHEMIQSLEGKYKKMALYDFFLDLKNQFRTEISIDYTCTQNFLIYAVFYQKVV